MQHSLKHPYISVGLNGSYGGNQTTLNRKSLRQCGCGAVAMADFLLYVTKYHDFEPLPEAECDPIAPSDYDALVSRLQLRYLPMLPPFGITGISMAAGLSLYSQQHHLSLGARWGVQKKNFWQLMAQMLDRDLPVIFSIGPNFPFIWQKHKLNLYRKCGDTYVAVSRVSAHFVTATGLDENWIRISSWGKEYYIHRGEYTQYGKAHSISLAHNLLWIPGKEKPHG